MLLLTKIMKNLRTLISNINYERKNMTRQKYLTIRTENNLMTLLKEVSEENCESYSSYVRNLIRKNIKNDFPDLYHKYY